MANVASKTPIILLTLLDESNDFLFPVLRNITQDSLSTDTPVTT
jgi:hypothetical protein